MPGSESKALTVKNCSFCGKSQRDVDKLLAGPDVYICDECVWLCMCVIVNGFDIAGNDADDRYRAEVIAFMRERLPAEAGGPIEAV